MSRVFKRLIQEPLHLLLLPLYFILQRTFQFRGLLDNSAIIRAFLFVLSGVTLAFGVFYFFYRDRVKAAVATTTIAALYLFFGDIKFTLSKLPVFNVIAHYRFFIPLLLLLTIILFYNVRKSKLAIQLNHYFTLLFVLYFIIEVISFNRLNSDSGKLSVLRDIGISNGQKEPSAIKPNIYYILTDGYPSPGFQREVLDMKRASLDSILASKKFFLVKEARSNYSNTAFSMASVFGMNYLDGVDTSGQMAPYHYNRCMKMVRSSPFISFLERSGYAIYNLSIFDLEDHPAFEKDHFLSASTSEIIFYNTFYHSVKRDLSWQIIPGYLEKIKKEQSLNRRRLFIPQKKYNQTVTDSIRDFRHDSQKPFFVYLHLKMPHFPYFYDSAGKELPYDVVFAGPLIRNREKFRGYIQYTNRQIDTIVTNLLEKGKGQDIIIIQSDHGWDDFVAYKRENSFRNFSAFYFPDQDYRLLYETMSNVNTFRLVLNKFFDQDLPLLPDRSYYLK